MNHPNIFNFATSELSQDAFICWLLSWASPDLKLEDKGLHDCGTALIAAFFYKMKIKKPSKFECVKVHKQYKNIDVLCVVNNEYPIIIEDKTDTKNHSKQLERYYNEILGKGFSESKIIPIYYKTEDQSSYTEVERNKYKPFLRDDILGVLNTYTGTNQILIDYRERLRQISAETESYLVIPPREWTWRAWKGFYMRLQKELDYGNWGYVPNQSGGFLGFWWGFENDSECQQHLQLEGCPSKSEKKPFLNKLHLKIKVENKTMRSSLRDKWYKRYTSKANASGLSFRKPDRFGSGKHMATSTLPDYIQCSEGLVDIPMTVSLLDRANEVFTRIHISENELIGTE